MDVRPMRAAGWTLVSATAFACAAGAAVVVARPPRPDLRPVADRVHAFAVRVSARAFIAERSDDGRLLVHEALSTASGVLIGSGLALTDLGAVTLPRRDGGLEPPSEIELVIDEVGVVPARLIAGDAALGVAVLRLPEEMWTAPGASLAVDPPIAGDPMIALGADDSRVAAIGVLLEAASDGEGGALRLQTDRALPEAFWGGPLFDARGRLAGIYVRREGAPGTAVPASLLRPLVEKLAGARGI